jgi:hypothetical protein
MKLHSSADMRTSTTHTLISVENACELILRGASLAIAGPEAALEKLPAGNWIGGTTPYFLTDGGGRIVTDDEVFITDLTALGTVTITDYAANALERICGDAPDNGFAMTIMPAQSECHKRFALEAPFYADAFLKPTVGWIAGFNVETGGQGKVYDGRGPTRHHNRAVVAHVAWNDDSIARLEIINPFKAGEGDRLTFGLPGFAQTHCLVNGVEYAFKEYLEIHALTDMRRPLIGDHGGAPINVAIQSIDAETGLVRLYAPVFPDTVYRFAEPLTDYSKAFRDLMNDKDRESILWSCNCVLNFLLGELEGKEEPITTGPATFGEIAYQLMTQTTVILKRV